MGQLSVTEYVTLDGVAQAPGGTDEDRDDGFTYGGWLTPYVGEASADVFDQANTMDALLLGRRTFDIFASFWPTAPVEMPFTGLLNRVPKYVASRTLTDPLVWEGSTLVDADLVAGVTALKQRHDQIHVIGSINLVQSLLRFGLVDRLQLWMFPVLLGRGKKVFGEGTTPAALRLIESVNYSNGALKLTYETAGTPTFGTIGEEENGE
jgi:dihydrofolate reductase